MGTDFCQLRDGRFGLVREVGIAVAELLREVELAALGHERRPLDGLAIERETVGDLTRRAQNRLVVPAPLRLGALERRAVPDRDHRVLQRCPRRRMRVDVARDDRLDPQRLREIPKTRVSPHVAPLERPLELDEEALAPERPCQPGGGVRVPHPEPEPRAARQAHQTVVQLLQQRLVQGRIPRRLSLLRPGCRMRGRQEPAEVCVAARALHEQRHVGSVSQRHLRPGDRTDAERLRGVRELERPIDAVMVGESERLVAELGRPNRQLLGQRGAVQERVGGVRVKLGVRHEMRTYVRLSST